MDDFDAGTPEALRRALAFHRMKIERLDKVIAAQSLTIDSLRDELAKERSELARLQQVFRELRSMCE